MNSRIFEVGLTGGYPYKTIQNAVDQAQPGDTVLVHEGVYREEVIFPRGGTGEEQRITLKAAPAEHVTITASAVVEHTLWQSSEYRGVYRLILPRDFFKNNAEGEYFNPFAVRWMSKGTNKKNFFTCGCVYLGEKILQQRWSLDEVRECEFSWFAVVSAEDGTTTLWVNFGSRDPRKEHKTIEINHRMQCITAKWNQGYITVSGIQVMRGCGPKTIDFWMTTATAMYGAIAVNGGHHWVIENCNVTQCRGVAIDFGNGSAKQEKKYGGEPELYGYHIIRNNRIHENGTNGIMAYRGAYTEIYNNSLINNNALNTELSSEAYIKDVSGGWGIRIYDNYFYSDQDWKAYPIWMDSECDMCRVSGNIICGGGNGKGFHALDYECNNGWNLIDNNIFVGVGFILNTSTSTYLVNNLWIDMPEDWNVWPPYRNTRTIGTEGFDGYTRCMRIVKPGTLSTIGCQKESRWQCFNNNSKIIGNVISGRGLKTITPAVIPGMPDGGNKPVKESAVPVNGIYGEAIPNREMKSETGEPLANPDYSGGTWHGWLPYATEEEKAALEKYKGIMAWIPATKEDQELFKTQMEGGDAKAAYGNECDYNLYMNGAKKIDDAKYASAHGYVADEHSIETTGICSIEADENQFSIRFAPDTVLHMQSVTGEALGMSPCYEQALNRYGSDSALTDYLPDAIDTDFFGVRREAVTIAGPFASVKQAQPIVCWPKERRKGIK